MARRKSKVVLLSEWRNHFHDIENIFSDAIETQRYINDFIAGVDEKLLNEPERFFAYHFLKTQYHFIVLQLGKMIDNDSQAISFKKLLLQLQVNSHNFPVAIFDRKKYPWAFTSVDNYILSCGLSPQMIAQDIQRLDKILSEVKRFRNKHVAHTQRKRVNVKITKKELDTIMEEVENLLKIYNLILNQSGISSYLAVQVLGWEGILNPAKRN